MDEAGWAARDWRLALALVWAGAALLVLGLAPETAATAAHRVLFHDAGAAPTDLFPPYDVARAEWMREAPLAVALWPAAALGPAAFAVAQSAAAATLAPAVAALARRLGARPGPAVLAGALAVANPLTLAFATAGGAVPAAALALVGVLLHRTGRFAAAAGSLAAAGWVDLGVLAPALGLLLAAGWVGLRDGRVRPWPLRLDVPTTSLAAGALAMLAPAAVMFLLGLDRLPPIGRFAPVALAAGAWLAIPLALGWWRGPRGLALAATVAAVAAIATRVVLDGSGSALVVAAALSLALAAATLAVHAGRAVAVGLAVLIVAAAWAPVGATPRQGTAADAALPDAVAFIPRAMRDNVFAVDTAWAQVPWLSEQVEFLGWADTRFATSSAIWAVAIEEAANATLVQVNDGAFNRALRDTYADCVLDATPTHVVLAGRGCPGRADALRAAAGF